MAANVFDQASRYAAKLDAIGLLRWLLKLLPRYVFLGWLDTRTVVFPGEEDRTCDTVAWLQDETQPGVWWALTVEFLLEPDADMFGRLLIYLGRLWREKRPTDQRGERFQVGGVVVNLTGQGATSRDMQLAGTAIRTCLGVEEANLATWGAADTLAEIAAGRTSRGVLPWIPLLQGGGESAIIERWKELAQAEPDSRRRAEYAGLALVFAEAASVREAWKQALQGWNMRQSQQVLEWQEEARVEGRAEGRLETKANDLVRLVEVRWPPGLPPELVAKVRATTELAQLNAWFDAAAAAPSLEAVCQHLRS
jgi:hypothetical protein